MFGTPKVWFFGFAAIALGLFLGAAHIRYKHTLSVIATTSEGKGTAVAEGKAATATLEAATKTAAAERAAEAETPLPRDRADKIALCKRSASCKERRQFQ